MATTVFLDAGGILRVTDTQTLAPAAASFGRPDFDKRDFVTITGNAADIIANQRVLTITGGNDDAAKLNVHVQVVTKNGLFGLPRMATANRPAASAALNGFAYYDTTTNKFVGVENGAYANLI